MSSRPGPIDCAALAARGKRAGLLKTLGTGFRQRHLIVDLSLEPNSCPASWHGPPVSEAGIYGCHRRQIQVAIFEPYQLCHVSFGGWSKCRLPSGNRQVSPSRRAGVARETRACRPGGIGTKAIFNVNIQISPKTVHIFFPFVLSFCTRM